MQLKIQDKILTDDCHNIIVEGRLNAVSALELKEHVKNLVASSMINIIVDLSGVSFIDSSGLAALVSGFKTSRSAGGVFKLSGLNEQTMTVIKITRLDRVFEIYPDVEHALASMKPG